MFKLFIKCSLLTSFFLLFMPNIITKATTPFDKSTNYNTSIKKQPQLHTLLQNSLSNSWTNSSVTIPTKLTEKPTSITERKNTQNFPHFPPPARTNQQTLSFFGEKITAPMLNDYIKNLKTKNKSITTEQNAIIKQFNILYSTNWHILQPQLIDFAHELKLSDWAYCLLINKIAEEIYEDNNAKNLFVWFMLYCSDIYCELVTHTGSVYVAFPCQQKIYNLPITKNKLYIHNFSKCGIAQKIETVVHTNIKEQWNTETENVLAKGKINLYYDLPNIRERQEEREFFFSYNNVSYFISCTINTSLLPYFNEFPVTELPVYFETTVQSNQNNYLDLVEELRRILNEQYSTIEKLNCLLAFTQSLRYEKDNTPYFPVQTLVNFQSDCEDRALLFAKLAYELLGMKAVGLEYGKEHVAIGIDVRCDSALQDLGKIKGADTSYVICEPTYPDYLVGEINSKYETVRPKIIQLSSKKGVHYTKR